MPAKNHSNPEIAAQTSEITRIIADAARHAAGDFYGGKRQHKRFFASNPFEAEATLAEGPQRITVTLHDISVSGLSCWSKQRLTEDATLRVREFSADDSGVWLSARVTHCTPGIRGYLIGAEFEHPADEAVLERIAAENEPAPAEAPQPSWWRRLIGAFGRPPHTA